MADMVIRAYRQADLEPLRQITMASFKDSSIDAKIEAVFGELNGTDWAWRKARHIDRDADAQPDGILVAEADGRPVGFITSRYDRDTRVGWIPNLAILPEYQGRGVGKKLMQACLDRMRARGMRYAKIETMHTNERGDRFYRQVGFSEVARIIHFFADLDEMPKPHP